MATSSQETHGSRCPADVGVVVVASLALVGYLAIGVAYAASATTDIAGMTGGPRVLAVVVQVVAWPVFVVILR